MKKLSLWILALALLVFAGGDALAIQYVTIGTGESPESTTLRGAPSAS